MDTLYFDFDKIGKFSSNDIAYAQGNHGLDKFYEFTPNSENLSQAAEARTKDPIDRPLLSRVIRRQYERFCQDPGVFDRIAQLENPQTFTVITAHQPTLLTGPLYFIYKISSS